MTWSDGTVRAPEGRITVKATSPTLAELATARVAVSRPSALGCCATASCPGFGACTTVYPAPATVGDLEPLVIDEADRWGVPPHYLMAQVVQEAGTFDGHLNAYAFRYEPTSRDFKIATGDHGTAVDNQRYLLHPDKALRNLAVGAGSAVAYLPCEQTSSGNPVLDPTTHLPIACVPGQTPPEFHSAALVQDPVDPSGATWLIPNVPQGAVLLAPRTPDVVVLEGPPEILMWVALADLNAAGGARRHGDTAVLQATCVDAVVIPHVEQRLNFSLGCYGCREATDLGPDETVLGFPGGRLPAIRAALDALNVKAVPRSRAKAVLHNLMRKEESHA